LVEPLADRRDAQVIWVARIRNDGADGRVYGIAGLRVIVLDTSVSGYHHGQIACEQS
jgi:hypothetical protein